MVSPEPASLQLLLDSFVAIASERSPEAILEQSVDLARLSTRARYGAAALLNADGSLGLFVHQGLTRGQIDSLPHLPRGLGMLKAVIDDKAPIRRAVLQDDERSVGFPTNHVAMAAYLGVPIRHDGEALGALYLSKPPGHSEFSEQDELFIFTLARQTAIALEAARLLEEKDRVNARLRETDRLKSDFVAMASHELRTPLTSIRAATSMVRAYWDTTSEERKLSLLEIVENQAQRLSRLVDNILTAATLEAGGVRPQISPVDLVALAHETAADFAAEAPVAVAADGPCSACGDAGHIRQVLVNLVGNALKYGRPPFTIRCTCDAGSAEVRVEDRGPGVPPEFVPRLFDKFTQASTGDTRETGGSGLGLSIVAGLAASSGGGIRYETHPDGGAVFVLRLPREPPAL